MALKIYNTLSGKKETLRKPKNRALKLFVCGPTVYDYSHIGHARTYIFFDLFVRWLRHLDFKIFYLQNITNIDDKIINRAEREKKNPFKLADFFTKEYLHDMKNLGVQSVDRYAKAGDFIKEIHGQIKKLYENGFVYQTKRGVYFEIKKFKKFGKLSRQNLNALRPGWRIEPDPDKKDPLDFALWKFSDQAPNWPSPWGKGRPGWHIEDTAITEKILGSQYDLHGGGNDLKFPHHEAEIAQAESSSGQKPFVKIWIHTGFLLVNGEKMSKSLGNFITIRDFLKKFPPEVLRMIILNRHYRSPLDYNETIAKNAQNTIAAVKEFLAKLELIGKQKMENGKWKIPVKIKKYEKDFQSALADDFNTPEAIAVIFKLINDSYKNIWQLNKKQAYETESFIKEKLEIFGFKLKKEKIPLKIAALAKKREKLRECKQFIPADRLRKTIQKLGYMIEDTPYGSKITPTRFRS
ncbi:MAG: cysteine--tRNA ligase [Candidatus Brennerbacteria bacterium]|nr:cysteine--tRNA ligase [Candidatus Brennerbacteria bacterium]